MNPNDLRKIEALLDEFDGYTRPFNCSDRHCMLGGNAVGTNGGCKCWDDRNKMRRYLPAVHSLHRKIRDAIRSATSEAVPDGWVLVPREPTQEMIEANGRSICDEGNAWLERDARTTWAAMLAAAPNPKPERQEGGS